MTVELKEWLAAQIDTVIDYIKEKVALRNGSSTEEFEAKENLESETNVTTNSQMKVDEATISEAAMETKYNG